MGKEKKDEKGKKKRKVDKGKPNKKGGNSQESTSQWNTLEIQNINENSHSGMLMSS